VSINGSRCARIDYRLGRSPPARASPAGGGWPVWEMGGLHARADSRLPTCLSINITGGALAAFLSHLRVENAADFGAAVEGVPLGEVVRCGYVLPARDPRPSGGGAGRRSPSHLGGDSPLPSEPPSRREREQQQRQEQQQQEEGECTLSQEKLHRRLVLVEEALALAQAGWPLPAAADAAVVAEPQGGGSRSRQPPQPADDGARRGGGDEASTVAVEVGEVGEVGEAAVGSAEATSSRTPSPPSPGSSPPTDAQTARHQPAAAERGGGAQEAAAAATDTADGSPSWLSDFVHAVRACDRCGRMHGYWESPPV
jgi:hypothetical protein